MIIELNKDDKTIKFKSDICLMCGHKFSKVKEQMDLHLSEHHGVPGKMKPVFKIIIPVHIKCHRKINSYFITKSEFVKMENKIKSLSADFLRLKNGLELEENK